MNNALNFIKKGLFVAIASIAFTSCENENLNGQDAQLSDSNDVHFKTNVQQIAKKYNYKVTPLNENESIFKVANVNALKIVLERIKSNFETPQVKSIATAPIVKNTVLKKKNSLQIFKSNAEGDPPYSNSITVYFDNEFPCSNVYLTVDYNVDSNGNITSSNVTTGSYGYAFGNTYSQTGMNISYSNGSMVFQVTGQFTTSIGIGSFSLTNSNNVLYWGFLPKNGGGGGFVKQQSNDQTEAANN